MKKTVFVVEPQELFVDRLRQVLTQAGLDVIGVSVDINLGAIVASEPNVVFLDADFLGDDPRNAVREINGVAEGATICVYTQGRGENLVGSCCVLSKGSTEDELLHALRALLADGGTAASAGPAGRTFPQTRAV